MDPAIVAAAQSAVEANPRGAPLVVADEATHIPDATVQAIVNAMPVAFVGRPCALEDAPLGSKVVVSRDPEGTKHANLTTPNAVIPLPSDDLAFSLPVGAKIRKVMPSVFEATELNPPVEYPKLIASSARAAMDQYRDHFHKD